MKQSSRTNPAHNASTASWSSVKSNIKKIDSGSHAKLKEKEKAPVPVFGTTSKRFGRFTLHPKFLGAGACIRSESESCDPCRYSPKEIDEVYRVNKNRDKGVWRCKVDIEEWSKNLGYRNQRIIAERRWQDSVLGPAWTELPPLAPCYEPAFKNVSFGRTPRFKSSKAHTTPGPGTHYHEKPFKAPYGPHSARPTFERESPCRFKDTTPSWAIASTRYSIIDYNSIEMKSKKIVSLKGPYNLFSGERDGPTYNHLNRSNCVSAKSWPINLPGSLETYNQSHLGEMNRTGRDKPPRHRVAVNDLGMAVRGPDDPGPAHYDIDKPRVFKNSKYGFHSSYDKGTGYVRSRIWPGVGRYTLNKPPHCGVTGQGHRHVFLSKLKRTIGAVIPEPMNTF